MRGCGRGGWGGAGGLTRDITEEREHVGRRLEMLG